MKNGFYQTGAYPVDHSAFGGIIYEGDFDERRSIKDMASRILSDWRFDNQCRKNAEIRNNQRPGGKTV